jgi:hypothetical protein
MLYEGPRKETFRKRHQPKSEGINGIKIQYLKKQLHLRKEKKSSRIFRAPLGLKMRKEGTSSLTAKDVGTLTTLETFAHTNQRKTRVMNLDQLAP